MGQFELLINTGRKRNMEHLGDVGFFPHYCKNISPLGCSLSSRRSLTAHRTMHAGSKRCCRRRPQTSMLWLAEFSSNTTVSSFTAASCCFRPGLFPLQLGLALQITTKRGDNHFKFHIQTVESMEIKCCVLHSSEKFVSSSPLKAWLILALIHNY